MLKKTIVYTDYDGNERTEDFYFNLSKTEVIELELSTSGSLTRLIQKISVEHDNKTLMEIFKKIILMAYGEKSLDGKRFVKSEEMRTAFSQTEAYVELFMELATNADAAAAFINGIMPQNVEASAVSANGTSSKLVAIE